MQRSERWTETYERLLKEDRERTLDPGELETLALSAYLTGKDAESFHLLERAHLMYGERSQTEEAVRCAFWLGQMLSNAGEIARGSGWIARGERILRDAPNRECAEKGLLLLPGALGELYSGNPGRARELFGMAASIGEQFQNVDLLTLGRLGQGQALIQLGKIAEGTKLLDETMITLETEKVFPLVNGIVYCAAIETCRKAWDLGRAQEWTEALTRWCDAQPDIVPFRGECLVRRAEIMQLHGEWSKALAESREACDLLTRQPGNPAAGEAFYRKAELLRLAGDIDEAEDTYREAAKRGRNPQPGLALLRLAQGQLDAAETSIRNTLQATNDTRLRAELLHAMAEIMIAVNRHEEASEAVAELSEIAGRFDVPYLYAASSYCRGAVLLAEGKIRPSLENLQNALKIWETLNLPYESARTRELKGLVYRELNDADDAEAELAAARWIFEQLHAVPDVKRLNRLLNTKREPQTYGLTLRELQVLRLVANGNTNKRIAGELFISERTVDRHVSNIFIKLSVNSRVEASTFAVRNGLMENGN